MATRQEEELKNMRGASAMAYTPFSQARGAEAIRGFGSGMAPRLSEPASIFGASSQQSSQDFSRLQMPPSLNIPLGNTIPAFPDNYNQAMTDRSRAPSAMVSGPRDTTSGFGIYGGAAQLGSGQTPPMAPVTNAISSFASPLASRTERIESPYGTASTTLTPEQQVLRSQARQQAEQMGTMPRTPEQQQAALDRIRQNAPALNQQRTDWVMNTIQQRRDNPTTYTTPSGMSSVVPTNRFGEPLKAWMDQLSDGRLNYGPRPAPQTASASARQRNQGVRFAPNPSRPIPMPVVDASGSRIGVTSDYQFDPYESFTNSMASNFAPPTLAGRGNRTVISGAGNNGLSPMSSGSMPAFDFGPSGVPSYLPSSAVPYNNLNPIISGFRSSPFGSGFEAYSI
jgi:hypothetical protein